MNKLDNQNALQPAKPVFVDSAELAKEVISEQNAQTVDLTNIKGKNTNNEKEACAKKVVLTNKTKNRTQYFIRQYATGSFKNEFYNPVNGPEIDFDEVTRSGNEAKYKWVKVNQHMHNIYERYLLTLNSVYYTQLKGEYFKYVQ